MLQVKDEKKILKEAKKKKRKNDTSLTREPQ